MDDALETLPIVRTNATLKRESKSIPWLWEGVVAEETVTLLSAPEKIGKTTLLSLLLDRRREGGQLLGRTVYPGKTILCSEENDRLWALRQPPLDFGPDLIYHRPQLLSPSRKRWKQFMEDVYTLTFDENPFGLLVIDTAASFLPMARNPRLRHWTLAELRLAASIPAGVLVLNQSRNMHRPLAAFADIVIEMKVPRSPTPTRRRIFTGAGRYPGTLETVTADLNAEGTDYAPLPDSPPPPPPLLTTLQTLLCESPTPLTRQELLARWPAPVPRPDTLWRTLSRGCQLGMFIRSSTGTKTDAFRYALRLKTGGSLG
jgi:hypothetical protein